MELDTLYKITVDPNQISDGGIVRIRKYLREQNLVLSYCISIREWMVQTGEYRGKLPKRIASFLKKEYNIKLTSEQRTAIGNIAKSYMLSDINYTFDLVDKFDWKDGDFGDGDSCFWGTNALALDVLMKEGVLAIRFYDESLADCPGSGRAWIYKWDQNTWILFNSYGLETRAAAGVLAKFLTKDTGEQWDSRGLVYLTVSGRTCGLVYLNSSPQVIFVRGSGPPDGVNLDWPKYVICDDCEVWITDTYEINGRNVCGDCYNDYGECRSCGGHARQHDLFILEGENYCHYCYKEREKELEKELGMT